MEFLAKTIASLILAAFVLGGIGSCTYYLPQYNIYQADMNGQAQLAEAESNRKIAVYEAQAELDSASLKAKAEVERAKGVAEANKIIADGLGGPDGYLRYLYIDMLRTNGGGATTIYVPTEAGLPILEAGRQPF